jgi:tripartite ATP-independent transporter DctM subunit
VLVVLGDQLGVSVGKLFLGALTPGLGLAFLFALYLVVLARLRPELAPAIPREEREAVTDLGRRVLFVLIPPLSLILIVLGSIFAGVATPTEAGALGAVGAMFLAATRKRLSRRTLDETMHETLRLTCMVVFLLVGSTAFALVFRGLNGDLWIESLLTNLPGGLLGFLIVANLAIFILGFFIDFFEIAFILLPLLTPAARSLGIDGDMMVWFGVMIAMNLQTSFLTPPFGFSLFYLRGVTPKEIPTSVIYRGVVPFILIQLFALAVVAAFPEVVTYLL